MRLCVGVVVVVLLLLTVGTVGTVGGLFLAQLPAGGADSIARARLLLLLLLLLLLRFRRPRATAATPHLPFPRHEICLHRHHAVQVQQLPLERALLTQQQLVHAAEGFDPQRLLRLQRQLRAMLLRRRGSPPSARRRRRCGAAAQWIHC